MRFWQRNQEWENPAESVSLMCGLVTFSFYPHVILIGLLLWIVAYALLTAPQRPGKPQEMYADPEDDDDQEEVGLSPSLETPETLGHCCQPILAFSLPLFL